MSAKLEKELRYYIEHQDELVEKYNGKFLVIIGEQVVDVFDDLKTAYLEASAKYELGTFMIHRCSPGEASYTKNFRSRVVFA